MPKIAAVAVLGFGMALASPQQSRQDAILGCFERCRSEASHSELQAVEIHNLERECVRAIQLNNGTFFRRVLSDDFVGTLSHGQPVNKTQWIDIVQSPALKYQSFTISAVGVRFYQDIAVATSIWSFSGVYKGQRVTGQLRAIHVYVSGSGGWHVVASQATKLLPPMGQPL